MVSMNLFAGKEWRCRCREWTYRHSGGGRKGKERKVPLRLFATPWTVNCQAPLSMGFSRQECRSGLPSPSPGDLPDPGIEPSLPH